MVKESFQKIKLQNIWKFPWVGWIPTKRKKIKAHFLTVKKIIFEPFWDFLILPLLRPKIHSRKFKNLKSLLTLPDPFFLPHIWKFQYVFYFFERFPKGCLQKKSSHGRKSSLPLLPPPPKKLGNKTLGNFFTILDPIPPP